MGGLIGYYVHRIITVTLLAALGGFALAGSIELTLGRLGAGSWLYRRRVLLLTLLEIPLFVFVIGPYTYVLLELRPIPHTVCCQTPLDFGASTYESVQIQGADNVTLAGWFVPPQRQPGPLVILLHGAKADRLGTAWHAARLIEAGYGVLLYDQRALGESSGDTLSLGWLDGDDLLAVIAFAQTRPQVDPSRIGAVGLSGGGHIALNALHQGAPLKAVWIDGLQAQGLDDFPTPENFGERFATLINGIMLRMAELHLDMRSPPPFVEILTSLDAPAVTLVAGGLDDFERRVNEKYSRLVGGSAEVWMIPQAWHVGGPLVIPEIYTQRMLGFFNENLD